MRQREGAEGQPTTRRLKTSTRRLRCLIYAEAYYNRGTVLGKKGEYDKAIEDFTNAIKLKPDYAEAYNNRGNAWSEKGEYDKAIEDYTKAIALKPDFHEAYFNRGNAWSEQGRTRQGD